MVSHAGGAVILDAGTLSTVGSVSTTARPGVSPLGTGHHVALTPAATGQVLLLDTGDPARRGRAAQPHLEAGRLAGSAPGHVVGEHGKTAVFDDGSGVIQVFRDDQVERRALAVNVLAPFAAHHGIAVPLPSGYLVSVPAVGSTARVGLARIGEDGRVISRWDTCPGLHGDGPAKGGVVAFGCDDGVVLYRTGSVRKVTEPAGTTGRVSALAGTEDSPVVVGNFSSTELALIDTRSAAMRLVDLGRAFGSFTRDDSGDVVVLGVDGAVHLIDEVSGRVTGSVPAIPAWTPPTDFTVARPTMTLVDGDAVICDPRTDEVLVVDLAERRVARRATLPVDPFAVFSVTGHQH